MDADPVLWVHLRDRNVARNRWLRSFQGMDRGALTVPMRPVGARLGLGIPVDTLRALGKPMPPSGSTRGGAESWGQALGWIGGAAIDDVVLLDAQTQRLPAILDAANRIATVGARLWLVTHEPHSPALEAHLREFATEKTWVELASTLGRRPRHQAKPADPAELRPPPVCEELSNGWRSHLAIRQRRLADAIYDRAAAATTTWLNTGETPPGTWPVPRPGRERSLAGAERFTLFARCLLQGCTNPGEAIVTMWGMQAGAATNGWRVNLDYLRLASELWHPLIGVEHPDALLRLLRQRDPAKAAAACLLAFELPIDDVRALNIADVEPDGSAVTLTLSSGARRSIKVSSPAALALRAHLTARRLQGARSHDPLFIGTKGRINKGTLRGDVLAVRDLLAVSLLYHVSARRPDSNRWSTLIRFAAVPNAPGPDDGRRANAAPGWRTGA